MYKLSLVAVVLATSTAHAGTPLDADAFEAFTTGKTLEFARDGGPFGAEQYLSNRRVRWTFFDGECQDGRWYPQGEQICFVYDTTPEPQCWTFFLEAGGLSARFAGAPGADAVYQTRARSGPLQCLGPEVGA